jgi:hypothetical protein
MNDPHDPLAPYRKKPVVAPTASAAAKDPEEYVAFDAKDHVERLIIMRTWDHTRSPKYHDLMDITYDGPHGYNFILWFSFMMMVEVEGKNLQPVIKALQLGTAEFIREFDPDKWPKPKDEKAPIIESIKVVKLEGGPPIIESKKHVKEKPGLSLH